MCTSIVCPCSSVHATDYLWLPSWHRLRSCIDIGVALSWHRLRIILTSASRYSWHRLRINSNNPSNPTYLSSAELPNSLWHRLRIILTSASHSARHRLRIVLNRWYKFKIGYNTKSTSQDIGFAEYCYQRRITLDIGFALSGTCPKISFRVVTKSCHHDLQKHSQIYPTALQNLSKQNSIPFPNPFQHDMQSAIKNYKDFNNKLSTTFPKSI